MRAGVFPLYRFLVGLYGKKRKIFVFSLLFLLHSAHSALAHLPPIPPTSTLCSKMRFFLATLALTILSRRFHTVFYRSKTERGRECTLSSESDSSFYYAFIIIYASCFYENITHASKSLFFVFTVLRPFFEFPKVDYLLSKSTLSHTHTEAKLKDK